MPDPRIYSDWRAAKGGAGHLAAALSPPATILQLPGGGKRVLFSGRVTDCTTWLGVYSYLHQLLADQTRAREAQAEREARELRYPPGGPTARVWDAEGGSSCNGK